MNRRELLEALILLMLDRKRLPAIVSHPQPRTVPPADLSAYRTGERRDYRAIGGEDCTAAEFQAP